MRTTFASTLEEIKSRGKRILVVGLGVTGLETARFLLGRGIRVVCTERQSEEKFRARGNRAVEVEDLRASDVEIHFGIDGEDVQPFLTDVSLAVLSPGVPLESAIVGAIARVKIPYVSELELGIELHGGQCIVVTGSNGKSTTVSLIHHILAHAGVKSFLCGNVGIPVLASDELKPGAGDERSVLVVEASSYQLEACTALKPHISVILNISENHLERHGTLERYATAKAAALRLQGAGDTTVLNADDVVLRRLAASCKGEVVFFGKGDPSKLGEVKKGVGFGYNGASSELARDEITAHFNGSVERYSLTDAHLMGEHNRYNMSAAVAVCRAFGIPQEKVQSGLLSFQPLEHRLEIVEDACGVLTINDSKSTTVAASKAAYQTVRDHFSGRPLVVMIGGLSKAGSWEPLIRVIKEKGTDGMPVVCFGKDGGLLGGHCAAAGIDQIVVPTLKEGVIQALSLARSQQGIVLLTPGCASFDEFNDFEHRGRVFKEEVRKAYRNLDSNGEVAA